MGLLKGRILHTQAFSIAIFLTLMFSTEGWGFKHVVFEESLFLAGIVLVAMSLVGRAWSLSYVSGNKNSKLIMTGPYSLCRNPLYFSNMLGAVGLGLCTETLTLTLVVIAAFALYYPRVIRNEESRLQKKFGREFASYCSKVNRFIPVPKGFIEGEHILIGGPSLRKGFVDLGAFIIGVGVIEFLEALHKAGVLPTLLVLY